MLKGNDDGRCNNKIRSSTKAKHLICSNGKGRPFAREIAATCGKVPTSAILVRSNRLPIQTHKALTKYAATQAALATWENHLGLRARPKWLQKAQAGNYSYSDGAN